MLMMCIFSWIILFLESIDKLLELNLLAFVELAVLDRSDCSIISTDGETEPKV